MASALNSVKTLTAGTGVKTWIPLNRYGPPHYQISVALSGVATYDIEGTNSRLNRGEAAVTFIVNDADSTPVSGQTESRAFLLALIPMEAIRVNQTAGAGTATFYVQQQGSSN